MMSLVEFFSQPLWHRLGLTLVHFLWQGLVVAVVVYATIRVLGLKRGNPRYAAYLLAFAVMTVSPLLTFMILGVPAQPVASAPGLRPEIESSEPVSSSLSPEPAPLRRENVLKVGTTRPVTLRQTFDSVLQASLPWALVGWMGGVLILSVRLLLGFLGVRRWRRHAEPLVEDLEARVARLSERLGLPGFARVFTSHQAREVVALGYLRPMVLLPAALVTQMPPEMLEAVIAHELAHIRRLDLWVNLAQRVVETLLFYHPAVWWLSSRLRSERELCCDELAVQVTGERLTYASALETAGRTRWAARQPVLALELGHDKRSTLGRIRHVLGLPPSPPDSRFWLAGIITVALLALIAMPAVSVLTVQAAAQAPNDGAGAELTFGNATNLGPSVNSSADDYDPSISTDELELYFNSYRPGGLGQADLWVTTRKTKADPWGSPANLGPTVNSSAGDKGPNISTDGLSLHFCSARPGGHGGQDLWVTTRETKGAPWGDPVNLGPAVNSPANEQSPSISADRLTLYFTRWPNDESPGAWDQGDLWVTTRKTKADPWGHPVNLGPTVNSPAYDGSPFISDDGLSLYFDSERGGGSNIWVTKRKSTSDPWGTPVKLGSAVNAEWEANPDISRDGSTLYFVSTRGGSVGRTDIWQATLGKRSESTPDSKAESKLAASLHEAAKVGDLEQVKSLISKGTNINALDGLLNTPLCNAVDSGNMEVVKLLVDAGADVNADKTPWPRKGIKPLHEAAKYGHKDIAELLIASGADVNAKDEFGDTPLHYAVSRGHADVTKLLIAKGADINAKGENGSTPLLNAIRNDHKGIAELLITSGADPNVMNDFGQTPLHHAASKGSKDVAELLITKGANINNAGPGMALYWAAESGYKEIAELLIIKGADVNLKFETHRFRPVHGAVRSGHKDIVELLVAHGATVSPFHLAAFRGDLERVKRFVEDGDNVDIKDECDYTPLYWALWGGQKTVAEFLIAKGADVNTKDMHGMCPLDWMARNGNRELAELLISKGSNVNADSEGGDSPLYNATVCLHRDVVELLIAHGANVNAKDESGRTPLFYANNKEVAELLIAHGADINTKDKDGKTPLHRKCEWGPRESAKVLIAKGADINAKDKKGRTPLWLAKYKGRDEIVELLLKHGAKEDASSAPEAPTPGKSVHEAAATGNIEQVKSLIAGGADPNLKDYDGKTPLSLAKEKGHNEIVEFLQQHVAKE